MVVGYQSDSHLCPSLTFAGKAGAYSSGTHCLHSMGKYLTKGENDRKRQTF